MFEGKRIITKIVWVLLVVLIAYAGCATKPPIKFTRVLIRNGWTSGDGHKSNAVLRQEIVRLRDEINKARKLQAPDFLLTRLDALEESVLHTIYELGYATTTKRKEEKNAEVAIEAQRVTIEVLQKMCRLYEDSIETQRATIEILKQMCRLHEDEAGGL